MLTKLLEGMKKAKVLVIGDLMLDKYWEGVTERISPEAPVPIVNISSEDYRPGGAANVALNARALGADVTLLGHIGQDEMGDRLVEILEKEGIHLALIRDPALQTISKVRVLSHHQQLIRLDFEKKVPSEKSAVLMKQLETLLPTVDVLLCSDYAKGTLCNSQAIISLAKSHGKLVLVDPKSDDFEVYRGASLLTPNLKEFEKVVGPCEDESEITQKGFQLMREKELDALLVTRGSRGMTLLSHALPPVQMPTKAQEVYDVSGAGDTVIACMAVSLAGGASLIQSAQLANLSAGIVVGKLGTATVTLSELKGSFHESHKGMGIVSLEQAQSISEQLKAEGKKLVMTNGCFDLLHRGHLNYLEEAKRLGDYLMVAVNSDESVKRLKGNTRPIQPLADRMNHLAALKMVDWVVAFDEDTPENLYCHLLPNVLVKGGDYKIEELAGHQAVLGAGGEVKILDFVEGYSSSSLIDRVRTLEEKAI